MLKIGMLSKWHVHAGGYAKKVQELGHKVSLVWDDNEERGKKWADELGCPYYSDLSKALATDIDGVIVDNETSRHRDVMVAAAKAGKHIFTEKTIAPTVAEALEIKAAVDAAGVIFTISYPSRTSPVVQFAKKMVDNGDLGKITLARFRNAHSGSIDNWLPQYWYVEADACGGAMMDLGCHPMYIASHLFGKPARITSMYNDLTNRGVDDNAVNLIEFTSQAIAIVESGFVTPFSPWMFEIYGTEGTILGNIGKIKIQTKKTGAYTSEWLDVTKLPKPLNGPMESWFSAIENGTPVLYGMDDAIALAELLENAYISHKEQRTVAIK